MDTVGRPADADFLGMSKLAVPALFVGLLFLIVGCSGVKASSTAEGRTPAPAATPTLQATVPPEPTAVPSPQPEGTAIDHFNQLMRKFGDLAAVKGITFQVEQGEVFGFLGPNRFSVFAQVRSGLRVSERTLTSVSPP
jgi:hypothetical protein